MTGKIELEEIKQVLVEYIRAKYGLTVTSDKMIEAYVCPDYDQAIFTGFEINLTDIKSLV